MADDVVQVIYAWVADGIGTIFVSDEGLDATWATNAGFTGVHVGLVPPTSLPCGTDLRSGMLTDDTATIHVDDTTGELAALFKATRSNKVALVNTLEPDDTGGAAVQSKNVGTEYIAADGSRREYSCIPGFAIGLKHYGQNEAFANDLGSTPVSDDPIVWEGRRCALYRVKYVAGAWQALSAAKRLWWGQLRGRGDYKRGRWSFSCFGIQSWLAGNLGRGKFADGIRVLPTFAIDNEAGQGEHIMYAALDVISLDSFAVHHDYGDTSVFEDTTSLVGAASYGDIVTAINAFCDVIVADTTNGTAFNANADGNDLYYSTETGLEGIVVKWKRGDTTSIGDPYVDSGDATTLTCRFRLWAHEKVWRTLGYDPRLQNSDRDPVANEDQYGQFQEVIGMPGYWQGAFYSASPKAMAAFEKQEFGGENTNAQDCSNGGVARAWPPIYPGGAAMFTGEVGQEFELVTADPVLLSSSKSRPLIADPDDETSPYTLGASVGAVNAQAILVLEGPYRRRGDEDQVDPIAGYAFEVERERREGMTVQVVRVCFRQNSDGTVKVGTAGPRFVVYQWYDPRLFGIDFKPLQGTWGCFLDPPDIENAIKARPLSVWDARDAGDRVSEVLQRVMLTTGTGGSWYSDSGITTPLYGFNGEAAYFDAGDNDNGASVPTDAEDATLGLGIPASMVADPEDFAAVEDAALGPQLRRCKVAAAGVLSARELFARLLSPTGLAIGLSGGKYGIFDAWALPTPADSVLSITTELYGGEAGRPETTTPQQALRQHAAIDKLEVRARIDPSTKDYEAELEIAATDSQVNYRGQQIKHQITGDYLLSERVSLTGNDWRGELAVRWRKGFDFWATDHTIVTAKLHMEDAIDVWPGDGVLLSDTQLVSADGEYGISVAAGRVLGRDANCQKNTITLRILVGPETEFRMYAPSAVVTRYFENEGGVGYKLACEDDHFGDRPTGTFDVDGFAEPSWSTEGGSATIECLQFDGSSWSGGIYGTVSSVTSSAGSCSINLTGALTGATFYRDRWTVAVLRTWASQAAWPKRWYAPICESDNTHSGGTDGVMFMGV